MIKSFIYNDDRGFVALITILIVTSIALILGTTIILKSITQGTNSLADEQAAQAWAAANACAEYALARISTNGTSTWDIVSGYRGNESLPNGSIANIGLTPSGSNVSCSIATIEAGTNDSRIIKATSTVGDFTRKIRISAATNTPSLVISSWSEVGDF